MTISFHPPRYYQPFAMISPNNAWKPLPETAWNNAAARHLASRLGYSVNPRMVRQIEENGPLRTLQTFFARIHPQPAPEELASMRSEVMGMTRQMQDAGELEKRQMRQEIQRLNRQAYSDYAVDWYAFARNPRNSAQEKLVQFFQDVWVVSYQSVKSTNQLFEYQNTIRRNLGKSYPEMCKALAVTPAMIRYLNLDQNRRGSPNENFARELFELFTLGEGNYTEQDIKEAARATTGYTANQAGRVSFAESRHDSGRKTIFGKSGKFNLEQVLDLAFEQPAAARFLPRELAKFYLTEENLDDDMIQPLADIWSASGFSIPQLVSTFFTSRIFYQEAFRGNLIKSPTQYYLGLLQDFNLEVFPSARRCVNQARTMGQQFFNPPNVRGWVGGRHWINSATLSARRSTVESLLNPIQPKSLNADEQMAMERVLESGDVNFTIPQDQLMAMSKVPPDVLAKRLADKLYANPDPSHLQDVFRKLEQSKSGRSLGIAYLTAALTAPAYHLC